MRHFPCGNPCLSRATTYLGNTGTHPLLLVGVHTGYPVCTAHANRPPSRLTTLLLEVHSFPPFPPSNNPATIVRSSLASFSHRPTLSPTFFSQLQRIPAAGDPHRVPCVAADATVSHALNTVAPQSTVHTPVRAGQTIFSPVPNSTVGCERAGCVGLFSDVLCLLWRGIGFERAMGQPQHHSRSSSCEFLGPPSSYHRKPLNAAFLFFVGPYCIPPPPPIYMS
jgi:hypothetical protein